MRKLSERFDTDVISIQGDALIHQHDRHQRRVGWVFKSGCIALQNRQITGVLGGRVFGHFGGFGLCIGFGILAQGGQAVDLDFGCERFEITACGADGQRPA